jgi:uncharacterized protein (TIGR00288 family)
MKDLVEKNLCVLIDFENISAGCEKERLGRFDIQAVMNRLKDKGRILEARAYGDWGRYARFKQSLLEAGVQMHELPSYGGHDKNRADIALVVDAMELAYTRDFIDTYVILSGDSDFTPLAMRLRSMNKRVIGIGTRNSTSRLLIASCDEFIFYESLRRRVQQPRGSVSPEPNNTPNTAPQVTLSKDEAFELLGEALEGLQKDDPQPVLAGLIKQAMQRKLPAFNESDYGFSGFARFLEAARDKGLVGLARAAKAGGYSVFEAGSTPVEEDAQDEDSVDTLPALIGPAAELRELLSKMGTHPLVHMIRHTVIHEFVDHVQERTTRNRKNTLKYTVGDTARRCRKTDPPVATRHVRTVINTLFQAGALLHADGNPVRSNSAPFNIANEPEELLEKLVIHYLMTLRNAGVTLDDFQTLSQLLYADDEHADEIAALVTALPPINVTDSAAEETVEAATEEAEAVKTQAAEAEVEDEIAVGESSDEKAVSTV